ncbi:MAG: hypothetical protein JNJ80_23435 [Gemmatimonadetes bacterium]|nr:hypothetical protein [Gemmatimonadota bacterium]
MNALGASGVGGSAPGAPPRRVLMVAVAIIAVAVWYLLDLYTTAGIRECRALYRAARTAADSAVVDTTVTAAARREADPRTCGFRRSQVRWR